MESLLLFILVPQALAILLPLTLCLVPPTQKCATVFLATVLLAAMENRAAAMAQCMVKVCREFQCGVRALAFLALRVQRAAL